MAAITTDDVATAIGRDIVEDKEVRQVEQWIDDVELVLTDRIGDLSGLEQSTLRFVEREAVVSRMNYRPDQDAQSVSDRDYFGVFLAPWWRLLKVEDPNGPGAFTIRPSYVPDRDCW